MLVVGVDGIRGGWVAVALRRGHFDSASAHASLISALRTYPDAAAFAVDVPIGLPRTGQRRRADGLARQALAPYRSRVFTTSPREVYEAPSYAEAKARAGGLTRQAWAIGPKILEAARQPGRRTVYEVHPELSFAEITGSVLPSKHRFGGIAARFEALRSVRIVIPADASVGNASVDDVLDAAAAAWTASRIASGEARTIPDGPRPTEPRIWI